ncbi:MAG: hypothetical protein JW839_04025, partial [Candidatus Lokiarchaeota archaeon]|nr:hypothetical protein [Candidatus Lokiarchaeota archaeon]
GVKGVRHKTIGEALLRSLDPSDRCGAWRRRVLLGSGLEWKDAREAARARRVAKAVLVEEAHAAFLPVNPRSLYQSWSEFVETWDDVPPRPTRALHPHLVKDALALVGKFGSDVTPDVKQHVQDVATLCKPWIAACYPTAQVPVVAGFELARQGMAADPKVLAREAFLPADTFAGMVARVAAEAPAAVLPALEAAVEATRVPPKQAARHAALAREIGRVARRVPSVASVAPDAVAMAKAWIDRRSPGEISITTNQHLAAMWVYRACVEKGVVAPAKALGIDPTRYARFCKATGLQPSPSPPPAVAVDEVARVVEASSGKVVDRATRDAIDRFLSATSQHLMGFTHVIAVAIVALVFATRLDPAANLTRACEAAGVSMASLHNATKRFLCKLGRPGEPKARLLDRVRAAFPQKGADGEGEKKSLQGKPRAPYPSGQNGQPRE